MSITQAPTIAPLFRVGESDYYRLHGMDTQTFSSRSLFSAGTVQPRQLASGTDVPLEAGDWFATGTFRNSFFLEPIAQFTRARDLNVVVDYEGALRFKVLSSSRGRSVELVNEVTLFSPTRSRFVLPLSSISDLGENARLFWHVDALSGGGRLHDVSYCTSTTPHASCRMAVLLRTFGRTTDIKALLKRFADAGATDPYYASILQNIEFWTLDTTPGSEDLYNESWQKNLNLRVVAGPNLGGGGNASHLLSLFKHDCLTREDGAPTEVLILDDDLSISMESLARYFMFCAYRDKDVLSSLPVLMKSRQNVVWEDGGFWGRLNFHEGGGFGRERNLFPNLLKHGMTLTGPENLDQFDALNTCEYSTFIFFGMSMKMFDKLGYPAAFFLRGDDIELSLRASEAGVTMFTNPNLAAWHEPAHSYGQEYMAILHGIIINLTYSDQDASFYARFFEERLHEHAVIGDLAALDLYKDVLTELLDPESLVLSKSFQQHYLPKLKKFGAITMVKSPHTDKEGFEALFRDDRLLLPFVYPGYHKDAAKSRSVVVVNHGANTYREIPPADSIEKFALMEDYLHLILRLTSEFDAVRARWQQRLVDSSTESFWDDIRATYADQTRELFRHAMASGGRAPLLTDVTVKPTQSSSQSGETGLSASTTTAKNKRAPMRSLISGTPAKSTAPTYVNELPSDFDPDMYLRINPDVQDGQMDPATHYLEFGMREGRRYRL